MTDTLRHRGPESGDLWVDAQAGVALGHRRLAILDLSPQGNQPMVSAGGRFVITFNGEIYNFRHLRADLEKSGERFRGHSDTEVLLAAIESWGLDEAISRCVGMFAFALWDRSERELHLVRDRLGKKPLYLGWVGDRFLFASELKAFHAEPAFNPEVDRGSLALFLRHSCVPAPFSIYKDVFKLSPGSSLALRAGSAPRGRELLRQVRTYWSALEVAERGAAGASTFDGGETEAIDHLEQLLTTAVTERMISDVPIGALLSGGIDSSTVAALMQKSSGSSVQTFTIGFREPKFDEAAAAARVARHLATEHHELYITPDDARAVIPLMADVYDEPFADQSQIPTFLVARFARHQVTVALSGDGGDEVFGGYQRHFEAARLAQLRRLPSAIRVSAARALTAVSPGGWDRLFARGSALLPAGRRVAFTGDQVQKFAGILLADDPDSAYRIMTSHWLDPGEILHSRGADNASPLTDLRLPQFADPAHAMMAMDTATYLPDDILAKVDRASMAVSLEVRAPLLDHRTLEFAWQLPLAMKIRDGKGKWILRRVLERYVPLHLVDRPKQGFGMPIGDWLRGSLKPWAESLLSEGRLREQGFFEPRPIREKWAEHLSGRRNWGYHLWDVLMFQAWAERWLH